MTVEQDILGCIREHKHNYRSLMSKVIREPAKTLLRELIANPDYFTEDEKARILIIYEDAIELCGVYDMLGKNTEDQIKETNYSIIPQIERITDFYKDVYKYEKRDVLPVNNSINIRLCNALNTSLKLCNLLANIDRPYGKPSSFNLRKIIDEEFKADLMDIADVGLVSGYEYSSYCGDLSDINVFIDEEGFRINVIGNLINNFHKHAFRDNVEDNNYKSIINDNKISKVSIFLFGIYDALCKLFKLRFKSHEDKKENTQPMQDIIIPPKLVRMRFEKDDNPHRINVIIENNGEMFSGDKEAVFAYDYSAGPGAGSGIGLASARAFLQHFDSTIRMFTKESDTYKVGFIINIPTL